jgi:hypothetical protein
LKTALSGYQGRMAFSEEDLGDAAWMDAEETTVWNSLGCLRRSQILNVRCDRLRVISEYAKAALAESSDTLGANNRRFPRHSSPPIPAPWSYLASIRASVSKSASSSGVQMWRTTNARSLTLQSPSPRERRGSCATSTEVRPSTLPAA